MASATAAARRPDLSRMYGRRLAPVTPGEFEFRLVLDRGPGVAQLVLDPFVLSFEWIDEEAALTGNVQLRRPVAGDRASLPIGRGHRIRCSVRWSGRWYELWAMRCGSPEVTVETGELSVDLKDDLDLVRRSKKKRVHRTTKQRRTGFLPHDLVAAEARRDGVRVRSLAKTRHRMSKVVLTGSLLDFIVKVYGHEAEKTGKRFIVRMRDGQLEVTTFRRNRTMYVLAEQIRAALVRQEPKRENPPTVLTGRGRLGKGSDAKKIRHTEYRRDMVRRFGYSHREKDYGRVDSVEELRSKVRRDLATFYRVNTTATVQVQGIPFIRRGDGCELRLPGEGFEGSRAFVFTTAVRHQVQGGTYTTECDVTRVDPFVKDQRRREREARARKRRERKRG